MVEFLPELNIDIFDTSRGSAISAMWRLPGKREETSARIEAKAGSIFRSRVVPVAFGGGSRSDFPASSSASPKPRRTVGVIHLVRPSGQLPCSGRQYFARCSFVQRLYGLAGFSPRKIVMFGIRQSPNTRMQ
jgi:arginase family enzyme